MSERTEDMFWRFAYERQLIFERRRKGVEPPWTMDSILSNNRFTNPYRAADRVSQYLIRRVQYSPDASQDAAELVFRTLLFRIFNKIETYESLKRYLDGHPTLSSFDPNLYGAILTESMEAGHKIWSGAYMMSGAPGEPKHRTFLQILYEIMEGTFYDVRDAETYEDVYRALLGPRVGGFLAMQFATDINYSTAVNFDENDWIMPGVGALRGAKKLNPDVNPADLIYDLTARQEDEFARRHLHFPWLGGMRRLHLIDVQNLLCEFDKYTREAAPDLTVRRIPMKIKNRFDIWEAAKHEPIRYFYPPKWHLSDPTA